MSQIRLFASIEFNASLPNSLIRASSFFTNVLSLFACSIVNPDTESSGLGRVTKSYISANGLLAALRSTLPLRCMYSLGFVVLASIKAVRMPGILTPSSRHFIATIACSLPPSWKCSLIKARSSIFSSEVKRATFILSSFPRILVTASICLISLSSSDEVSLSSITLVAPQYTRILLSSL